MNKIIQHSVRLHCNAHQAFDMFTVNECLRSWLAADADVEPVVGGKYELFWNLDNQWEDSTIGCKVTAIEPEKYLCFEWKGAKAFEHVMNNVDPLTHVVVFFIPGDELFTSCTDVYLVHSGWRDTPEWEEARRWFSNAWEEALEELQQQVNESSLFLPGSQNPLSLE